MVPKLLVSIALVLALLGCTHTVTTRTTSTGTVTRVPEVAPLGKVDTFPAAALEQFRKTHPSAGRCVYQNAVHDLYWQDDLKLDTLLLLPAAAGSYDAFKVQVVKEKILREVHGTTNGKRFQSTRIEDVK